jgi:hypothetical protein
MPFNYLSVSFDLASNNGRFGVEPGGLARRLPNGRNRRNPVTPMRHGECPLSTLLGHSAFAPGMALPAPYLPFAMPVRIGRLVRGCHFASTPLIDRGAPSRGSPRASVSGARTGQAANAIALLMTCRSVGAWRRTGRDRPVGTDRLGFSAHRRVFRACGLATKEFGIHDILRKFCSVEKSTNL